MFLCGGARAPFRSTIAATFEEWNESRAWQRVRCHTTCFVRKCWMNGWRVGGFSDVLDSFSLFSLVFGMVDRRNHQPDGHRFSINGWTDGWMDDFHGCMNWWLVYHHRPAPPTIYSHSLSTILLTTICRHHCQSSSFLINPFLINPFLITIPYQPSSLSTIILHHHQQFTAILLTLGPWTMMTPLPRSTRPLWPCWLPGARISGSSQRTWRARPGWAEGCAAVCLEGFWVVEGWCVSEWSILTYRFL